METIEDMLKRAINLHYHERPSVISDATRIIQDYCNKNQADTEYDEILKNLHELMKDLPSNILLYFLTTVPLPKKRGPTNSTFFELIKKSRVSLHNNMYNILSEFIKKTLSSLAISNETKLEDKLPDAVKKEDSKIAPAESCEETLQIIEPTKLLNETYSCKKLLNITVDFTTSNFDDLNKYYTSKSDKVWKLINKNHYDKEILKQCYAYIRDINKKLNWLRMIDTGYISVDVVKEMYGDTEIFLRERHLHNLIIEDAFKISNELIDAVDDYLFK